MIEHCHNCKQTHETGGLEPFEGVPVKECPETYGRDFQAMPERLLSVYVKLGYTSVLYRLPKDVHTHR